VPACGASGACCSRRSGEVQRQRRHKATTAGTVATHRRRAADGRDTVDVHRAGDGRPLRVLLSPVPLRQGRVGRGVVGGRRDAARPVDSRAAEARVHAWVQRVDARLAHRVSLGDQRRRHGLACNARPQQGTDDASGWVVTEHSAATAPTAGAMTALRHSMRATHSGRPAGTLRSGRAGSSTRPWCPTGAGTSCSAQTHRARSCARPCGRSRTTPPPRASTAGTPPSARGGRPRDGNHSATAIGLAPAPPRCCPHPIDKVCDYRDVGPKVVRQGRQLDGARDAVAHVEQRGRRECRRPQGNNRPHFCSSTLRSGRA